MCDRVAVCETSTNQGSQVGYQISNSSQLCSNERGRFSLIWLRSVNERVCHWERAISV